jgi:hypothetical protein
MNSTQRSIAALMLIMLTTLGCSKKNEQKIETTAKPQAGNMDVYNGCGLEGNAVRADIKELNILKNRYNFPSEKDFNRSITLAKIIARGEDSRRWNSSQAAEVIGYVYDVKPGGVETCNCKTKDILIRDTHIELVIDPMKTGQADRVVVEVTPRIRKLMSDNNIDWSTRGIRDAFLGRWVKVQGWMFFDNEHADEAENTKPGRERNWRGTAWEIHPVTGMEVVQRPKRPA